MGENQTATWAAELERLARCLGRVGPDEICCEGLTSRQCSILRTLAEQEGARISGLASATGITPSAMTRVLEKLESRDLVKRVRGNGNDGRAAKVAITARGREVRASIDRLIKTRTETILSAVPDGLRPQLLAAIRVLNQVLEPGGCCQITGDWPQVAMGCSLSEKPAKPKGRKSHAKQECGNC